LTQIYLNLNKSKTYITHFRNFIFFAYLKTCRTLQISLANNFFVLSNLTKTESCVFHLSTNEAAIMLDIKLADTTVQHVDHPKYLGVTLDRPWTYNAHLTRTAKKVNARVNLVWKLAGTNWGASTDTLRTAALALVCSTAEYCSPVWLNSIHVSNIDVQLNTTMRIISGTLKSTQLQWLPVLANIPPPKLRRKAAAVRELIKCRQNARSLLYEEMLDVPIESVAIRPVPRYSTIFDFRSLDC
jgi:hypothetical protein